MRMNGFLAPDFHQWPPAAMNSADTTACKRKGLRKHNVLQQLSPTTSLKNVAVLLLAMFFAVLEAQQSNTTEFRGADTFQPPLRSDSAKVAA